MGELHIIRTDVLLWALEGFKDLSEIDSSWDKAYPNWLCLAIQRIVKKPRASHNELKTLSEKAGGQPDRWSLAVMVCMLRKGQREIPAYWPKLT